MELDLTHTDLDPEVDLTAAQAIAIKEVMDEALDTAAYFGAGERAIQVLSAIRHMAATQQMKAFKEFEGKQRLRRTGGDPDEN